MFNIAAKIFYRKELEYTIIDLNGGINIELILEPLSTNITTLLY